jgi:hypothetical protein
MTEMRTFMIAAIIAGLAVPAHAQTGNGKGGGKLGQKSDEQTATEQQQKKNEENAYKDALKKIPDQPGQAKGPVGKHALSGGRLLDCPGFGRSLSILDTRACNR